MDKQTQIFKALIDRFARTYSDFEVWKEIHKPEYKLFPIRFWETFSESLALAFSIKLARILEKQNPRFEPVLAISIFTDKDKQDILASIKPIRDKILMHNDLATILNGRESIKEFKMENEEFDVIFEELFKFFEKSRKKFNFNKNIKDYVESLHKPRLEEIKQFLYFLKAQPEMIKMLKQFLI